MENPRFSRRMISKRWFANIYPKRCFQQPRYQGGTYINFGTKGLFSEKPITYAEIVQAAISNYIIRTPKNACSVLNPSISGSLIGFIFMIKGWGLIVHLYLVCVALTSILDIFPSERSSNPILDG
jgi:hypothetical protein